MDDIFDHEHEEEGHEDMAHMPTEEEHPLWASERIELKSVGIDIGSTTSHLMFSRLVLRRQGMSLSSKFRVVETEITYQSPVVLTPFVNGITIDTPRLAAFISQAYEQAGLAPQEINTGAVTITGEAARKENAAAITALFSEQAGKFVCATAGPNLEAKMAAYGSGAVDWSWGEGPNGATMMSVDVGGGTSKVAIAHKGSVMDTAALNVGARLFIFDEAGRLIRVEEPGKIVAAEAGVPCQVGYKPSPEEKHRLAQSLAMVLFQVMGRKPLSPLARRLMITPPLSFDGPVDAVVFSGGVSEYIYGYEKGNYGDLGAFLAEEIRMQADQFGIPVKEPQQRIRATVIGASQYTVQVSGSTIFISEAGILPLRNLPVVIPKIGQEDLTPQGVELALRQAFRHLDIQEGECPVAIALRWTLGPSYPVLKLLVQSLMSTLENTLKAGLPVVLVFDLDIGRLVGSLLAQELRPGYKIISIDGIDLQDFDYIDIGEELPDAGVVPVVIKSLIFRT